MYKRQPFGFTVDSDTPQSIFCQPTGSVTEPSNSYVAYNILDAEMEGYLCDEINHYETLSYGDEYGYVVREGEHSLDAVLKGGIELRKLVSTTGPASHAPKLEGAGFTIYRIPDLSKADQFTRNPDGSRDMPVR